MTFQVLNHLEQIISKRSLSLKLEQYWHFQPLKTMIKLSNIIRRENRIIYPPKKGRKHILRIIREPLNLNLHQPKPTLVRYCKTSIILLKEISFLISDFINKDYEDALKITSKKHDLIVHELLIRENVF